MEHGQKLYAAKTVSWPGATPFCPAVRGPNPLRGLRGSRPATTHALRSLVRCFAAYEDSRSCSQLYRDCLSSTCVDWKGTSMPLLKPPEPQVAVRRFYVR